MNPKMINDSRPLVWTVSVDPEARKVERNYCLYTNGHLYRENMTVEEFLTEYDSLTRLHKAAGIGE